MVSRVTLAMMEAAAIDRHLASPRTMARLAHFSRGGTLLPSTSTSFGRQGRSSTASAMAHSEALRMFSASMRSTPATPTPTCAVARICW